MKPRIKTQEGRDKYKLRQQTVERVFGIIKGVLGFRKFMLRGLDKAKLEWTLEPIVSPGGYLRNDGLRPTACSLQFCSVGRIGRFGGDGPIRPTLQKTTNATKRARSLDRNIRSAERVRAHLSVTIFLS